MNPLLAPELRAIKNMQIKPNYSALSRKYGMDRHTLKKYYEKGGKFDKERSPKGSKYDELRGFIASRLGIEDLPIRGIWFAIEHEYPEQAKAMSYRGLVSYVRKEFEAESGYPREAHPRFETGPGEQLQVEWMLIRPSCPILFFSFMYPSPSFGRRGRKLWEKGPGDVQPMEFVAIILPSNKTCAILMLFPFARACANITQRKRFHRDCF